METVHTVNRSIRLPRVILLTFFDKLPCKELKLTRNNVFERDGNRSVSIVVIRLRARTAQSRPR